MKKPSAGVGDDEPNASSLVGGGTKSKEKTVQIVGQWDFQKNENFSIIFCNESHEVHTGEKNKKNRGVYMQINGIP